MDIIIFEDGERIRKKAGKVINFESSLVHFSEADSKEYMLIPRSRIIRIILRQDGGIKS
jgi:hypothetical protein